MTISSEILGALATLNVAALAYLANTIHSLGKKLDKMVCEPLCKERSEKCQKAICHKLGQLEAEDERLWKRVNAHSHTEGGEVIIPYE